MAHPVVPSAHKCRSLGLRWKEEAASTSELCCACSAAAASGKECRGPRADADGAHTPHRDAAPVGKAAQVCSEGAVQALMRNHHQYSAHTQDT